MTPRETAVEHTPGPWIVVFADGHSAAAARDEMDARGMIRHANETTGGNVTGEAFPLALMRAAPDLLAACRAIVDGWEHNLTEPMALVRAAIARAEGRQP